MKKTNSLSEYNDRYSPEINIPSPLGSIRAPKNTTSSDNDSLIEKNKIKINSEVFNFGKKIEINDNITNCIPIS